MSLMIGIANAITSARPAGAAIAALKKYPNFPQTMMKQLRQSSDVSIGGPGVVEAVASGDFVNGRSVVRVTSTSLTPTTLTFALAAPLDVRNGHVSHWLKRSNNNGRCEIRMFSSGSVGSNPSSNYHQWGGLTVIQEVMDNNVFAPHGCGTSETMTLGGTGANLAAVTIIQIRLSGTCDFEVSDMQFVPNPRTMPAVILRIDDAWKTMVRALFAAKGINPPITFFPGAVNSSNGYNGAGYNTPPTNNPDRMSIEEVSAERALYASQSGIQSFDNELDPGSYEAGLARYLAAIQYNREQGWIDDAADFSYYSNVNMGTPNARAAMIAAGARTVSRFKNGNPTQPPMNRGETFPPRDPLAILNVNISGVGQGTNTITQQVMSELDRTKVNNGVLGLGMHNDADNADVQACLNALADRYIADNDFEWHTYNSLFDPYLALYGPAPTYPAAYSLKS